MQKSNKKPETVIMVSTEIIQSGKSDYEIEQLTGIGRSNVRRWRNQEAGYIRKGNLKLLAASLGKIAVFYKDDVVEFVNVGTKTNEKNPAPGYLPEGAWAVPVGEMLSGKGPGLPFFDGSEIKEKGYFSSMGIPNPEHSSGLVARPPQMHDLSAYALLATAPVADSCAYVGRGDTIYVSPTAPVVDGDLVIYRTEDGPVAVCQINFDGSSLRMVSGFKSKLIPTSSIMFFHKVSLILKK